MSTMEKVGVAKVSSKSFYSAWAPAGTSQGSNSFLLLCTVALVCSSKILMPLWNCNMTSRPMVQCTTQYGKLKAIYSIDYELYGTVWHCMKLCVWGKSSELYGTLTSGVTRVGDTRGGN